MQRPTLLLIENDDDTRIMIRKIIFESRNNFNFVEADNGKQALSYLQKSLSTANLPHFIILELDLPVLDGKETLKMIKANEITALIPLVVFTKSSDPEDEEYCKLFGVHMLTKPPNYKDSRDLLIWAIDSFWNDFTML